MKKLLAKLVVLGLVLSLTPVFAQDEAPKPDKLILGMVPSREAQEIVDSLDPLAELLGEKLGVTVEPFIATSYVGVVEALGTGRIDIAMLGAAAMPQAIDRYGAEPIVASVRFGSSTYKSQFSVQCDSGIDSFEDLEGKSIAFVDPGSASGYQFPYVYLKKNYGIDASTDMNAIFAGSHDAAMLSVYQGDVDVATTFNDARTTIEGDFPDVMEKVCVLGYTGDIPNDGVVVRGEFSDEFTKEIQQALIDIANSEEGKALLEAMINVTGFEPVTSEAYDPVREVSAEFERGE